MSGQETQPDGLREALAKVLAVYDDVHGGKVGAAGSRERIYYGISSDIRGILAAHPAPGCGMTNGTDMPRAIRGVIAVLALIAKVRRTTLPPLGHGYRAVSSGQPLPGESGYPPPPPRSSKGGATPAAMRAGKRIFKGGSTA